MIGLKKWYHKNVKWFFGKYEHIVNLYFRLPRMKIAVCGLQKILFCDMISYDKRF